MFRRITVELRETAVIVGLVDRKILDAFNIQDLGDELWSLVDKSDLPLILVLDTVEFLSSAALNKLWVLKKRMEAKPRRLYLCALKPEVLEVFVITRMNQSCDIKDSLSDALAACN